MKNYYNLGLATPVRHTRIGAIALPGPADAKKDFANSPDFEFKGFAYDKSGKLVNQVLTDSRDEAGDWFGLMADNPALGYAALFDKKDPTSFPSLPNGEPLEQFGGSVLTLPVTAKAPSGKGNVSGGSSNLLLGLAIAAGGLGLAVAGSKKGRAK